ASLDRSYAHGHTLISQRQVSGATSYYCYDGHGNVRLLARSDGATTDTYAYDAFGILIEARARDGSGNLVVVPADSSLLTPNSYRYCGEQFDPDLGLYYNRARYLNSGSGRFWTMDAYEGGRTDPLG